MIGFLPFLISCLSGYYLIKCIKGKDHCFDLTDVFAVPGLGLGISSQIVFYTLICSGHFNPYLIIPVHLLFLCCLFLLSCRCKSDHGVSKFTISQASVVFVILGLVTVMALVWALLRPWGDWDGWSYWNYRAFFFFRSGDEWPRMFEFNIQSQHPWTLPLTILWGWSFYGSERAIVPMALGIIFTVSTVGLLIGALKKYVSFFWAALGGIFLISVHYYTWHGTSQYADIEAAYFILLCYVLALDLLKLPSPRGAVFTGLCLGLCASVKDNGMVAALLLLILIIVRLRRPSLRLLIRPLVLGFIVIGISVVLMRSFEGFDAFHHAYAVFWPGLFRWQRWALIGCFVWRSMIDPIWGGLWLLAPVVLIVQGLRRVKLQTGILTQFIIIYILLYFFIFVVSASGIKWLLTVSFDRFLYLMAPAVVFVVFYAVGSKEEA